MNARGFLRRLFRVKEETFTPLNASEGGLLPLTQFNYARAIRDGIDSNVVMAPIQWLMRAFVEAEPVVERKMAGKPWAIVEDHQLAEDLQVPNPGYDGASLFQASVISYILDGNGYWIKRRNRFGGVVEYWYVPHWTIAPQIPSDGSRYITAYDYAPDGVFGGRPDVLPVSEVVHLRFGLDPRNTRKGISPLRPLMREVFTDEEAAHFSATLLRNMGVPGVVLSPKVSEYLPTQQEVTDTKEYMRNQFKGDNRGEPLVMGGPTDVVQFGFDPNRLTLASLRDIAEERVCAMLGVQAAVVGFGAGLQSTKVGATMRELRRLSWLQGVIPMQTAFARQLTRQLMPEYESLSTRWRVRFDTSGVSAFAEEETEKANRLRALTGAGIMRIDHAQEAAGVEVDPSQNVYLRPAGITVVREGDAALTKDDPKPAPASEPAGGATPDMPEDDVMKTAALVLARMKATSPPGNGTQGDVK